VDRAQLEHAIRAACTVADDEELWVVGSQAVLGQFPAAAPELRQSIEVDVIPKNRPEQADLIDGSLGELSQFHETHGFYVHGISLDGVVLPTGWKKRCINVKNENTRKNAGLCLEAHDLATSKLAAGRDKDKAFVRTMLRLDMCRARTLLSRLKNTKLDAEKRQLMETWIRMIAEELR
jgi:hypothetical protein